MRLLHRSASFRPQIHPSSLSFLPSSLILVLALPCLLLAQYVEDSIDVGIKHVGYMCHNSGANVVYGCGQGRDKALA